MEDKTIIDIYLESVKPEERSEIEAFFGSLSGDERDFIIRCMEGLEFDNLLDQLTLEELKEYRYLDDEESTD